MIAQQCSGGRLLDIGYAQMPNPYFKNVLVTGLDIEKPSEPSGYEEELIGDAMELSSVLGDRQFEWIVAAEFIEHLSRPYDFLAALHRHIAPDGQLVLSTPNPVAWPPVIFEWANSSSRFYTPDHLYYFAPRWVKRMLELSGYQLVTMLSVGLWLPILMMPCPATLSYQVIYIARKS